MTYTPVVKARDAEIGALLSAPPTLDVVPLFELQSAAQPRTNAAGLTTRTKSTATDASYFLDDIARSWARPLYLDVHRVAPAADRGRWWALLAAFQSVSPSPATIMPVVSELDPSASRAPAAPFAQACGRAALRVHLPHPNPAGLAATMNAVATDLGLPATAIDVVLDWGNQMEDTVVSLDNLVINTNDAINGLGSKHGALITVGTPNDTAFTQVGDWDVTRREWWLWLRLAHAGLDVTYGDYMLYSPADPVPATPQYGHLRYSSDDKLWVHRRAKPATGGGLGAAFAACCAHLVGQPHYLGAAFSPADAEIQAIAAGTRMLSQAGAWRGLSARHHLALVNAQLTAPPVPPPPGTL